MSSQKADVRIAGANGPEVWQAASILGRLWTDGIEEFDQDEEDVLAEVAMKRAIVLVAWSEGEPLGWGLIRLRQGRGGALVADLPIFFGHRYREWANEFKDAAEKWAREQGATVARFWARPGLAAFLHDYRVAGYRYQKVL